MMLVTNDFLIFLYLYFSFHPILLMYYIKCTINNDLNVLFYLNINFYNVVILLFNKLPKCEINILMKIIFSSESFMESINQNFLESMYQKQK